MKEPATKDLIEASRMVQQALNALQRGDKEAAEVLVEQAHQLGGGETELRG